MTKTSKVLESGWSRVKFGDVVRVSKERCQDPLADGVERFIGLEHIDPEDLRIKRWGNVADGITFTNVFKPGQVLFGKRRAYQRKVAVANFSGVCSGDIYVLESQDATILLPELLPFICQTEAFFDHAVGTSAGSLSPRTNWKSLAEFEFALPSIPDQERLVKTLAATTAANEANQEALTAARKLIQSIKNKLSINNNYENYTPYTLRQLLAGSPESGCSAPARDQNTGYFVLGLAALSRDGYCKNDYKPVEPTQQMVSAKLRKGDLLISRSNTVDRVGYVGIFDDDRDDVSFPDTMMRLNPNRKIIDPYYLEALLQTSVSREFIMRIAAGTSASMKKINRENLLKMKLRVPSLGLQQLALDELDTINMTILVIQSRCQNTRKLTSHLLTGAMTGRKQ